MKLGWQPGIQENSAVWDEEWDKFEDEGMQFLVFLYKKIYWFGSRKLSKIIVMWVISCVSFSGFSFVNEYNLDKQTNGASPKTKSTSLWEENDSPKSVISDSASNLDATSERPFQTNDHAFDTESTYDHGNNDYGRNFPQSPSGRSTLESPRDDGGIR